MEMTIEQLQTILGDHGKWIRGEVGGKRANLYGANLYGANLYGANLYGANLKNAKIADDTNLTGEPWKDYLEKVLPALLTAGGKTIEQIVASGCWDCHTWQNCPMHEAFGIDDPRKGPLLMQPRIEQFVQLFDADLIPCPVSAAPVVCPVESADAS